MTITLNGTTGITTTGLTSTGIDDNATSNAITIDASENVGIGTTTPVSLGAGYKNLDIRHTTGGGVTLGDTSNIHAYLFSDNNGVTLQSPGSRSIKFTTVSTERMRIDSSGTVGIGVVPDSFNTVDGALQVGTRNTITSFSNDIGIGYNHYYNSGWKYVNADVARRFSSTSTTPFLWQYAASGSADGAITWSEAMRIDSAGRVGIGASSVSYRLQVYDATNDAPLFIDTGSANGAHMRFGQAGTVKHYIGCGGGIALGDDDQLSLRAFDKILLATGNSSTERMRIDSAGRVGIGTSSLVEKFQIGAPSGNGAGVEFAGNGNTVGSTSFFVGQGSGSEAYIYQRANSRMIFATNNTERARIDSSGNLLVGTTSSSGRLTVRGGGSSSSTYSISALNSSGTGLFYVRDDGSINTGGASKSPYNDTTSSAANVVVNSSGFLLRSTSSARYKENIRDYEQPASIDALRPVFFNNKKEDDDKTYAGLIAEEVHEAGFTEFVEYNKDGEPDAVFYANMVALCIKEIQDLKAEVAALKGSA